MAAQPRLRHQRPVRQVRARRGALGRAAGTAASPLTHRLRRHPLPHPTPCILRHLDRHLLQHLPTEISSAALWSPPSPSPAVLVSKPQEWALDAALRNAVGLRFRLGLFDPIDDQPMWKVPPLNLHPSSPP